MERRYNAIHKTEETHTKLSLAILTRKYKSKDEVISGIMITNECNINTHMLHSVPKRTEHTAHSFSSVF